MWEKQLADAIKAGELAKRRILEVYKTGFDVETKIDNSPVTLADKDSDRIIREYLSKKYPDYAFLTEESVDDKSRLNNDYVWIVDPLDGTLNFVNKNNEFTINIALAYKHEIVVGVVIAPVTNEIYYATRHGGAFYSIDGKVREIHVNNRKKDLRVLLSISHHGDAEEKKIAEYGNLIISKTAKGAALKLCLIAKGEAELSIRLNDGTKEWDTAAPQIIVKEAGGYFLKPNGEWMLYNRENVVNVDGYYVANRKRNIIF